MRKQSGSLPPTISRRVFLIRFMAIPASVIVRRISIACLTALLVLLTSLSAFAHRNEMGQCFGDVGLLSDDWKMSYEFPSDMTPEQYQARKTTQVSVKIYIDTDGAVEKIENEFSTLEKLFVRYFSAYLKAERGLLYKPRENACWFRASVLLIGIE